MGSFSPKSDKNWILINKNAQNFDWFGEYRASTCLKGVGAVSNLACICAIFVESLLSARRRRSQRFFTEKLRFFSVGGDSFFIVTKVAMGKIFSTTGTGTGTGTGTPQP